MTAKVIVQIIGSLCILGGYIQPICLASIVKIFNNSQDMDRAKLGIVIERTNIISDSNETDTTTYIVQYYETNQIETVTIDQLQLDNVILPPNLLSLANGDELTPRIIDS